MAMSREERLARKRQRYAANADKRRQEAKEYREKNPDKVIAATHRWREANREKTREYARDYYSQNRDRYLEQMREWREAHPDYHKRKALAYYYADVEAGRAKCRAHRAEKVEHHRARVAKWFAENPEKVRDIARKRRARIVGTAIEPITEAEIFDRDGWCCYICGQPVVNEMPFGAPNKAVLEHVIPLAKGGTHTKDNVRCACHRCNQMKGAWLTPEEVRKRLAGKLEHSSAGLAGQDQGREISNSSASADKS